METLKKAIESFLSNSTEPAVIEPGEPFIPLRRGCYAIEQRGERLTLQAWDEHRNLVRRILRIEEQKRGQLTLTVEKFARREGRIDLIDRARPATRELQKKNARTIFRERLRLFLSREFAGWNVVELSSEADLEQSLSPAFPRAFLRQGARGWAAIGAGREAEDPGASLAAGIIWLDYLRRREHRVAIEGLAIFVPHDRARSLSLRIPFLDHSAARLVVFTYNNEDYAVRLDPADYGNVHTVLDPVRHPAGPNIRANDFTEFAKLPGFEAIGKPDGSTSLRVNGWEIARLTEPAAESRTSELLELARGVAGIRCETSENPTNPLYRNRPEAWLESVVRANLPVIDPSLFAHPIYGQAPTFAAGDRAIMDLLACDRRGRLAVIEIKAAADLQLPLLALDYWLRVKWHLDRGEFASKGYFPGVELRPDPPRLLLIAPALEFHPTTEAVLRYLSPEIEVERIGVTANWRKDLRIMFRVEGSSPPAHSTWRDPVTELRA